MNKSLIAIAVALSLVACGQGHQEVTAPIIDEQAAVTSAPQVQQPAPQSAQQAQAGGYDGTDMALAVGAGYLLNKALSDTSQAQHRIVERTVVKEVPTPKPAAVPKPKVAASKPVVAPAKPTVAPAPKTYSSVTTKPSSSRSYASTPSRSYSSFGSSRSYSGSSFRSFGRR